MKSFRPIAVIAACLTLSACASTQADFTPLNGASFAAQPIDHPIEIFQESREPDRAFTKIGELDVHFESTGLVTYSFDDAMKKMKVEARLAGADGVIDISEKRSRHLESTIYHVRGTAIRFAADP